MRAPRTRAKASWLIGLAAFLSLVAFGCGDPPGVPITIQFKAMVGDKPFACGQSYEGLGKTKTTFTPSDLRMFVHDVKLIDSAGKEVPVKLKDVGNWQGAGVGYLDFEDGQGECGLTGNKDLRTKLEGIIPEGGTYKGIIFTLGIPFAQNHANAHEASGPLGTTSMFWSWAGGYRFFRLDGKVARSDKKTQFYRIHFASMDCERDPDNPVTSAKCNLPNRPTIKLDSFVPGTHQITLDIAKLLANATLVDAEGKRNIGCQSEGSNPECAQVFPPLGAKYKSATPTPDTQTLFSVSPASTP